MSGVSWGGTHIATERDYILRDPRRAGDVLRYHTWPHVRPQSIAHHSWNIARIVRCICKSPSPALVDHCLFHDLGEVVSGDPPYPVKKLNPAFGRAHREVEAMGRVAMCEPWGLPLPVTLSDEDSAIFKLAEYIEMMEWGMDELMLGGNRFALPVIDACLSEAQAIIASGSLPEVVCDRATRYIEKRKEQLAL